MRKIKITALILAVLMVMAAFAGCASKSTVEDLEDRVSALEGKIDANQEQISNLATLIEALTKSQEDIKDSVDSNKDAQDKSNQEILDAIKDLTDKVGKVENDNKAEVDATAELQAAQIAAQTQLATLEANYLAKKDEYTAADYAKITEIIALAKINVNGAANKAAVEAIVPAALKELEAYSQVNDALYNTYLALAHSITDTEATKEAFKAAEKAVADAKTHYAADLTKLTAYVTVKAADPKDNITMDIPAAIDALTKAYNGDATDAGYTFKNEAGKNVTYRSLAWVKAEATALIADIKAAAKDVTLAAAKVTAINTAVAEYKAWATFAELLSPENVKLVTNKADLDTAEATLKNLVNAQNAYKTLGEYNPTIAAYESIFADYYRALDSTAHAYPTNIGYLHFQAEIYKSIDAVLNAWVKEYNLTSKEIAYIVDNTQMPWVTEAGVKKLNTDVAGTTKVVKVGTSTASSDITFNSGKYDGYVANRVKCEVVVEKYNAFVADILPEIKAMNKITALSNEAFEKITAINDKIVAWQKITADVKYTLPSDGKTAVLAVKKNGGMTGAPTSMAVQNILVACGLLEETAVSTGIGDISANNYLMLYDFEKPEFATFFETTYNTAATIAEHINKQIAEFKDDDGNVTNLDTLIDWTKELSTKKYLDLEGRYVENAGVYTVATADQLKASVAAWKDGDAYVSLADLLTAGEAITIAKFETVYKNADFDLTTALINYKALDEVKAKLNAKLDKLATDAATIISKSNTILKVADFKKDEATTMAKLSSKISLDNEAAVNEVYALYEAWIANGGIFEMEAFGLVKDSTTKYEYKAMFTETDTEKLQTLKLHINTLRKEADALVAAYNGLVALNTYKAFAVDAVKATSAISAFTFAKKASTGTYYVADATNGTLVATPWTNNTAENSDDAMDALVAAATSTQFNAIEAAQVAYDNFMANNLGKKYAAVETAKATCDAFVLLAKKAVAYANVEALLKGTSPAVTEDSEKTLVATTLTVIAAANDLAVVESAIENLVKDLAKQGNDVDVAACVFATVEFIEAK